MGTQGTVCVLSFYVMRGIYALFTVSPVLHPFTGPLQLPLYKDLYMCVLLKDQSVVYFIMNMTLKLDLILKLQITQIQKILSFNFRFTSGNLLNLFCESNEG